eukprot:TRINITY_DN7903_c0_g1_i4.p2 TRINITY_DN7903_c0_g1~~TRINITY_DN7903_c0_g1_i4.p2  ORF type:complete len:258 (-),score=37.89 TRINITY_DN7903_c0_g1_i4:105-878(-)
MVFGGYVKVHKSNKLYQYTVGDNAFIELDIQGPLPLPRADHSAVLINDSLVIFGGSDQDAGKLGDLWCFSLTLKRWQQFITSEDLQPRPRSGHSAVAHNGRMIVFGGNLGAAREVNEMLSWDAKTGNWSLIHSSKKVPGEEDRNSPVTALKLRKIRGGFSLEMREALEVNLGEEESERKILKKCEEADSPIVKIMENSVVMNARKSNEKISANIRAVSKFPCGRDGHAAQVHEDKLYIFGGDRCQIGYNDLFVFPLV